MSDEETEENPLEAIRTRAGELGFEGEEYHDYVEARMRRAGYRKGPGDWIPVDADDDDDEEKEDDGEPMTRGDWRRMQKSKKQSAVQTPPKKSPPKNEEKRAAKKDPWW